MVFVVVIAACLTSCSSITGIRGNGDVISQERNVEGFNGVDYNGVGNVTIHFTDSYRVVVTTDSNIQDSFTSVVKGSSLYIGFKDHTTLKPTELRVDIYMPVLTSISLRGVGNIDVGEGSTSDLEINLSGVGNVNAENYQTQTVTATQSGVGDIKVWAEVLLNANVSGVGGLYYKGNPKLNMNITGVVNKIEPLL
jgi:hypothetical protein